MRAFLGLLLAVVVVAAVLAAFGWIFFFRTEDGVGVGVNGNEAAQESRQLADTVAESMNEVGGRLEDVTGRNRPESAEVVETNP